MSIANFEELPGIMDAAKEVTGIAQIESTPGPVFSKDTLRIDVEGPMRPQLTLVDIPGLIQSTTKGVTETDIETVATITDNYILRSRTIFLAVISAQNDVANQAILRRVHKFDPKAERTPGIITKPDTLLARRQNRFFKESNFTVEQRALSEKTFFRDSIWKALPQDYVGVDNLRLRLSHLLLKHGKAELPRLSNDVEGFLLKNKDEIALLGDPRATISECRTFGREESFSLESEASTRRLRTDNLQKQRQQKMRAQLQGAIPQPPLPSRCSIGNHYPLYDVGNTLEKVVSACGQRTTADMDDFS
ncbi:P-loop containing nucleoside triphosphate hydrolase protein [Xylariaceae sp. AK1471]|nr:P-loop containing nucleoside triphosphate hydrolase protein [Xylariaceae sp. AK1471]